MIRHYRTLAFAALAALASFSLCAEVVEIGSAEELAAAIAANPAGEFKLTADIDCAGWTTCDFSGTLDGDGKTISGLTTPFFGTLSGTVENLTVSGTQCSGNMWPASSGSYGIIAKTGSGVTIRNCVIKDSTFITTVGGSSNRNVKLGGFVGMLDGNGVDLIENCRVVDCTLGADGKITSTTVAGGIVGYSVSTNLTIHNCFVVRSVIRMNMAGGILAQSDLNRVAANVTIDNCFVRSTIEGASHVGGIVANYGGGSDTLGCIVVSNCRNEGTVFTSGTAGAGGIIGYVYRGKSISILNSVNYGDIYANACSTVAGAGGILGGLSSGTSSSPATLSIDKCVNYGGVVCGSSRAGGIIGSFSPQTASTIVNCANHGAVVAQTGSDAGGIVGYQASNACAENLLNTGAITAGGTDGSYAGGMFGCLQVKHAAMKPAYCAVSIGSVNAAGMAGGLIGYFYDSNLIAISMDGVVLAGEVAASTTGAVNGGSDTTSTKSFSFSPTDNVISALSADHTYYDKTNAGVDIVLPVASETALTDGTAVALMNKVVESDATLCAWKQGALYPYMAFEDAAGIQDSPYTVTVTYKDAGVDGAVYKVDAILYGSFAVPPKDPVKPGYAFLGWEGETADLVEDTVLTALWKQGELEKYTVRFLDWDGQVISESVITEGESVIAPDDPQRDGFVFTGWDKDFTVITSSMDITAQYDQQNWNVTSVGELSELLNAKALAGYVFTIESDLDFSTDGWTSVDFKGTINGAGHILTGLGKIPLFETLSGTVSNLTFRGGMSLDDTPLNDNIQNANFGLIARVLNGGEIAGCVVDGYVIQPWQGSNTGFAVGSVRNNGTVKGCVVLDSCAMKDSRAASVGGLAGKMEVVDYSGSVGPLISGCTNSASLHLMYGPGARRGIGGIVGSAAAFDESSKPVSMIADCVNFGDITCASNQSYVCFGGIAGESSSGTGSADAGHLEVVSCANYGSLSAHGVKEITAGGIVGGAARSSFIVRASVNYGNVSALLEGEGDENDTAWAGGVIGSAGDVYPSKPVLMLNAANYGVVTASCMAGGLIAFATFNDTQSGQMVAGTNCANYAAVSASSYAGQGIGCFGNGVSNAPKHLGFTNCWFPDENVIGFDETLKATLVGCRYGTEELGPKKIAVALSAWAEENGYEPWIAGKVGDKVYPELGIFCQKPYTAGFMLLLY